ncbi:MAG: hypothetical protein WA040_25110 [Anaerolineae bacterium]
MVAIDTDVLLLAFSYHRDPRQEANSRFLQVVKDRNPAVAIYSVMELLGQLSFNMSAERLGRWRLWLRDEYRLIVLHPDTANRQAEEFFQHQIVDQPLIRMQEKRIPFLDALILGLIEQVTEVDVFVTWNVRHFRAKTLLTVLTPNEYLSP